MTQSIDAEIAGDAKQPGTKQEVGPAGREMHVCLHEGLLRRVVVPQALRRILPVLASTWVTLFKDTSLVSVIAVTELAYVSMQIRAQSFRVLEMLTAMAAIYWLLGYPQPVDRRSRDRMSGSHFVPVSPCPGYYRPARCEGLPREGE